MLFPASHNLAVSGAQMAQLQPVSMQGADSRPDCLIMSTPQIMVCLLHAIKVICHTCSAAACNCGCRCPSTSVRTCSQCWGMLAGPTGAGLSWARPDQDPPSTRTPTAPLPGMLLSGGLRSGSCTRPMCCRQVRNEARHTQDVLKPVTAAYQQCWDRTKIGLGHRLQQLSACLDPWVPCSSKSQLPLMLPIGAFTRILSACISHSTSPFC